MIGHAVMCGVGSSGSCFVPWCSCWCHRTQDHVNAPCLIEPVLKPEPPSIPDLEGSTELPAEGVRTSNAGEFAALWNGLPPNQREDLWAVVTFALEFHSRAIVTRMTPEDLAPRLERLSVLEQREAIRRADARVRARQEQARFWDLVGQPPRMQIVGIPVRGGDQ